MGLTLVDIRTTNMVIWAPGDPSSGVFQHKPAEKLPCLPEVTEKQ